MARASLLFALGAISEWPDGVAALFGTDIFERLDEPSHGQLLDDSQVQRRRILDNLARLQCRKDRF